METEPVTMTTRTPSRTARFVVAAALAAGLFGTSAASAQVCGDDKITASDALSVLRAAVGQPVDLVCTDQCAALETRIADLETSVAGLETLLAKVTISGNNL